ncbi:Uncharacterised protein [Actinobaculum suis]|uniref:Uncharacterized protein n=1 Tax=Actinobaculum suis TaxID=1657 RepID=A0A7Z8Y8Y4_9ACTO|nr:Uncharacterised protein [Actinobaculum suis]
MGVFTEFYNTTVTYTPVYEYSAETVQYKTWGETTVPAFVTATDQIVRTLQGVEKQATRTIYMPLDAVPEVRVGARIKTKAGDRLKVLRAQKWELEGFPECWEVYCQ